jgi:hypothetical protein
MVLAIDNEEDQSVSNEDILALLKKEGAIEVNDSKEAFNTSLTSEEELAEILKSTKTSTKKTKKK